MISIAPSTLLLSMTMALAAGLVGAFAVMRRMTLAADAISHVALPGIGLAIMLHVQPLLGALVMLLAGAVFIWAIERRTGLATETITGVVFAAALAVGSMLTSGEELIDALLGSAGVPGFLETAVGLVAALGVTALILWRRNQLVLALVSPEIAKTVGIPVAWLELQYLLMFAVTVSLGLRYLGALLMGSLIIIPAAAARRLSRSLHGMLIASAVIAVAVTIFGMLAAPIVGQKTGPVIVAVAALVFFVSLLRPSSR